MTAAKTPAKPKAPAAALIEVVALLEPVECTERRRVLAAVAAFFELDFALVDDDGGDR